MNRKLRNFFFGPQGSSYTKFSKQNEPTEARFKELFESQAFIAEVNDTAKTSEQGLIKLQTDTESKNRTAPVTGDFAKAVQAHQLPEMITTLVAGDVNDGAAITGRGITIQPVTRTPAGGSIFRRVWQFINSLIFTSSDGSICITEAVPGTIDFSVEILSTDGTVTVTQTGCSWDLSTNPGVGPAGENVIFIKAVENLVVRCDSTGTPLGALPTYLISMSDGQTQIDLTGINLADPTVFNPVVTNCTATYSHSGQDILVTMATLTADTAQIILQIKYLANWYSSTTNISKLYAGASGTQWVYKGELTAAPVGPSDYWWYKNPNTLISYFYEGGAWKILLEGRDDGPTAYTTLTNAGLNVALTNLDRQDQIIHVPAGIVLAGPITITTAGTFSDGFKFNVTFDGGFDMNGKAVTIFGKVYSKAQCAIGNIQRQIVYSITDTSWKMLVSNNDVWELGSGILSVQTVGTNCNASGDYSVAEGLQSTASGAISHAEGSLTFSSGDYSHAEGQQSESSGDTSHAEGVRTIASGVNSHSQNSETVASGRNSDAYGEHSVSHIYSSSAFSSGKFSIVGDCEELRLFLKKSTTNAVAANMLLGDGATTGIEIPTDCIVDFECRYTALQTAGAGGTIGDCVTQKITFSVQNLAGTLTLLTQGIATTATVVTVAGDIVYYESATIGALAATCVPVISGTKVLFVVTGEATKDVQHSCLVSMNINGFRNFVI